MAQTLLARGDCFNKDKKIKIIIEVPETEYRKQKIYSNGAVDFIEKIFNQELKMIKSYKQNDCDYYTSMVYIKVVKD